MLTTKEINEIVEQTSNACSVDSYTSWSECVRMLARKNFNKFEILAILRSKWTRWAADSSQGSHRATSKDLEKFVNKFSAKDVEDLTKESFPQYNPITKCIEEDDVFGDTMKEIRAEYFLLSDSALNKLSLLIQHVANDAYDRGNKDGRSK